MIKDEFKYQVFKDLTQKIVEQLYPNIHSLLISKNGSLIFEKYFIGHDQNFGKDSGIVEHTKDTLHDLRSITKSFISASIGIAINKNLIKNTDQKISDFFPEFDFYGEKALWNIYHFLTMTTGLDWDESLPYHDHENDEIRMSVSPDPVRFVFDKPINKTPGEFFNYCGGATHILAEIIERTSKTSITDFVKKNLFKPLGINKFEWNKYSVWNGSSKTAASSGLRLTSGDLMKFGMLYRNKGIYNGSRILTPEWIEASFTQRMEFPSLVAEGNDGYGYQFWMWQDHINGMEINMKAAKGFGDQSIYWDLQNDIIIVTTAGNYEKPDIKNNTYALLRNEIYPVIVDN